VSKHGDIVVIGGRNQDHSLCLYVEEGEFLGKNQVVLPKLNVIGVKINDHISNEIIKTWIELIYTNSHSYLEQEQSDQFKSFCEKYEITSWHTGDRRKIIQALGNEFDDFGGFASDVQFKLSGKVVIPGNKIIFAASREFTNSSFEHGDLEKSNEIELSTVSHSMFKIVKQFIYAINVEKFLLSPDNVVDVLSFAKTHKIAGLVLACEEFIISKINYFGPFEVMKKAVLFDCPKLIEYMIWHFQLHYDSLHKTSEFHELATEMQAKISLGQWPGEQYHKELDEFEGKIPKHSNQKMYCAMRPMYFKKL